MLLLIFGFLCGFYVGVKHGKKLPFKLPPYTEIVKIGSGYAVRRYWIPGFYAYLDKEDFGDWCFSSGGIQRYCLVPTLEQAQQVMAMQSRPKPVRGSE